VTRPEKCSGFWCDGLQLREGPDATGWCRRSSEHTRQSAQVISRRQLERRAEATLPLSDRIASIEVAIHPRLSLDNASGLETIVPFYSEDLAVGLRRRRVEFTNFSTWGGQTGTPSISLRRLCCASSKPGRYLASRLWRRWLSGAGAWPSQGGTFRYGGVSRWQRCLCWLNSGLQLGISSSDLNLTSLSSSSAPAAMKAEPSAISSSSSL
jgi:hypothetical protein